MKRRFTFNKKQAAALEHFDRACRALDRCGVTIIINEEHNTIEAVPLSRQQSLTIESAESAGDLPADCTDITDEFLGSARPTAMSACFTDKHTRFGLPKRSRTRTAIPDRH